MPKRPYGSGSITGRNGRFLAQYRHENGRLSRTFDSKKEASAWLARQHSLASENRLGIAPRVTLDVLIRNWLEQTAPRKPSSTKRLHEYLAGLLTPLGRYQASRLRPDVLERFFDQLSQSPATRQKALGLLRRILKDSQRWGLVSANPAALARPIPREMPEPRYWSVEQLGVFLRRVQGDSWELFWRLLCATALRQGELRCLRWSDVDLDAQLLRVRGSLSDDGHEPGHTKTRRVRHVPVRSPRAWTLLIEERGRHITQAQASGKLPGYVFVNPDGRPLTGRQVRHRLEHICVRAGLPPLHPHGLRHSAASAMLQAGEHPKVVQEFLGHRTIGITMDVYSHVDTALIERAAERFSAALERAERAAPDRA